MSTEICRTFSSFNSSSLTHSNRSNWNHITESILLGLSSLIFLIAFVGNIAALMVTFTPSGLMRLGNGRYLANLAIADSLRTCLIPFTIIPRMKRNFIFGSLICRLLPVAQGLTVSVGAFTLVCISVERYLATCYPLLLIKIRSNQHSSINNTIILTTTWIFSLLIALPNFHLHRLCVLPTMKRLKCERNNDSKYIDQRLYMLLLDVFYLLIPMIVMIILHTLIIMKMTQTNTAMKMRSFQSRNPCHDASTITTAEESRRGLPLLVTSKKTRSVDSSLLCRMDRYRRRALKLLIILIIEFFICWTPLYVYHTIGTFQKTFYRSTPSFLLNVILLLSFTSAACNPITYYFMSRRYRQMLYTNIASFYR